MTIQYSPDVRRSPAQRGPTLSLLCVFAVGTGACVEEHDDVVGAGDAEEAEEVDDLTVEDEPMEPTVARGPAYDIPGVGRIQYSEAMREVATIAFPQGGVIHFHELESEEGYGCTAFFPGDAAGDPALTNPGTDGCLATFLALTPHDAPIPAVLLAEADDELDIGDRTVVDAVDEPIQASELGLAAETRAVGAQHQHYNHTCGAGNHWVLAHCDEGGADHCDPGPQSSIFITSGATYRSSYQTGLYCGSGPANAQHYWWNGSGWAPIYGWSHPSGYPSSNYVSWSVYNGNFSFRRAISSGMGAGGQFRHYTKMCPGLVCATGG